MVQPKNSTLTTNLISKSNDIEDIDGNFTQGCKFSPDNLCLLTSTASDNLLRLYNTPLHTSATADANVHSVTPENTSAVLTFKQGDKIHDYAWYPQMNSYDPITCAFLATSRNQPIHLIDAYTSNKLRASYVPRNEKDELHSASCINFSSDGQKIYSGGFSDSTRTLSIFHTAIPGSESCEIWHLGKTKRSSDGQKGQVSALAVSGGSTGSQNIIAVGSRNPSSIYLYDERVGSYAVGDVLMTGNSSVLLGYGKNHGKKRVNNRHTKNVVKKPKKSQSLQFNNEVALSEIKQNINTIIEKDESDSGDECFISKAKHKWYEHTAKGTGISQLSFDPNNTFMLYSSARRSDAIVAWDLRMMGSPNKTSLFETYFGREGNTNQKLHFHVDGNRRLYATNLDHSVKIYDCQNGNLIEEIVGLENVPNGVSVIPDPKDESSSIMAVSLGTRRFDNEYEDTDDEEGENQTPTYVPPSGSIQFLSMKKLSTLTT